MKDEELIKETDEKFIERTLLMVFHECGCDMDRGIRILEECIKKAKDKRDKKIPLFRRQE